VRVPIVGLPVLRGGRVSHSVPVWNVQVLGADNTGAVDATAIIQQGIDLAYAAGGGLVAVPPGTYTVIAPPLGRALRLKNNVFLWLMAGATIRLANNAVPSGEAIIIGSDPTTGTSNLGVYGPGTVDGNKANNAGEVHGIFFGLLGGVGTAVDRPVVSGVEVKNAGYISVAMRDGCSNFRIQDCYLHDAGSSTNGYGISTGGGTYGVISGNVIRNVTNNGIDVNGETGSAGQPDSHSVTIAANVVEDCDVAGIFVETVAHVSVVGNTVRTCGQVGIFVNQVTADCHNVTVTGNSIKGCTQAGIRVNNNVDEFVLSGNSVEVPTAGVYANKAAIDLQTTFRGAVSANACTLDSATPAAIGIRIDGCGVVSVTGNILSNFATDISETNISTLALRAANTTYNCTTVTANQHRLDGAIALADGMTAPGVLSGYASIYVDTADGDLKVKFGDGFVRVIGADS
jgi:parallel beta-helix repeat protein